MQQAVSLVVFKSYLDQGQVVNVIPLVEQNIGGSLEENIINYCNPFMCFFLISQSGCTQQYAGIPYPT
jgi:hypothetical protein